MENEPLEDSLAHWGVKGMRWGVRRGRVIEGKRSKGDVAEQSPKAKSGSVRGFLQRRRDRKARPNESRKMKAARYEREKLEKIPIHYLTNTELKTKIERAKLEKEMRELEARPESGASKFIKDLVKSETGKIASAAGKKISDKLTSEETLKSIQALMSKKAKPARSPAVNNLIKRVSGSK